jgi:hypothetical protein
MADSITVNGRTTICMVEVSTHGKMAAVTKESTRTIESMDLVSILGTMESSSRACGKTVNNTEKASTEKMELRGVDSGRTATESNGSRSDHDLL